MPHGSRAAAPSLVLLHSVGHAVQLPDRLIRTANVLAGYSLPAPESVQYEVLAACSLSEPLTEFALWLVEQLGLDYELREGRCCVFVRPGQPDVPEGMRAIAFCLESDRATGTFDKSPANRADVNGHGNGHCRDLAEKDVLEIWLKTEEPFFRWLCRELHERGKVAHARPCRDPRSVYEISERLYSQYRVDAGRVHLSGCTLDDQPFLRLTFVKRGSSTTVVHCFFTPDGVPADREARNSLGLDDICPTKPPLPHSRESPVELLVAAGSRFVQSHASATDSLDIGIADEQLAAAIVWVKRAVGKLQFTIGDESIDLAFDGWARTLQAPPFVCPHTGTHTFHVTATDDGRIAAAEAVEECAKSGKRVLGLELVTCSVTGQRVLPQFTRACPVTGQPVLEEELAQCDTCRQRVSRSVLKEGVCAGCRALVPVPSDDPRIVWLLSEYPKLDHWRRWRLSETASLYIVQSGKLLRQVLMVFDKETLSPRYAAARGRFRKTWLPLDPTEQQDLFAERAIERP
jgi:hypothetical protein